MSTEVAVFISGYQEIAKEQIEFVWNGKTGPSFNDQNQSFREKVIKQVLKDPYNASFDLIYDLMHEEARWANKTLTFRFYLTDLLELLLENALDLYRDRLAVTFNDHPNAAIAFSDLKADDVHIIQWIESLRRAQKFKTGDGSDLTMMIGRLESLHETRRLEEQRKVDFEAYVAHRDPMHIAIIKNFKSLWKYGETTWLALFFIIPVALLIGYYLFGFAILYGMLPIFWALAAIYAIYRIVSWMIR